MKRLLAVPLAAVLVLAYGTIPAKSVNASGGVARGAVAEWYLDADDAQTAVRIQVVDGIEHERQAPATHTFGVNVQVITDATDPGTGSPVHRELSSDPYFASAAQLEIRALSSASVTASVELVGYEWVGDGDAVAIGPFAVDVAAEWMATGDASLAGDMVWDTQFGAKLLQRTVLESAPAAAEASITGDLAIGALDPTTGELVIARRTTHLLPGPSPEPLVELLAAAATRTTDVEHVTGAHANWEVGGEGGPLVNLDVEQIHGRDDALTGTFASLEVIWGACDVATDERVDVDVFSGPTAVAGQPVERSLGGASLAATFAVTGYETRTPGCAEASGEPVTIEIGPYPLTVTAAWVATGPVEHYRSLHWERSTAFATRSLELSRGRQASATGEVSGELISLDLGDQINAFTYDRRFHAGTSGEPPG